MTKNTTNRNRRYVHKILEMNKIASSLLPWSSFRSLSPKPGRSILCVPRADPEAVKDLRNTYKPEI